MTNRSSGYCQCKDNPKDFNKNDIWKEEAEEVNEDQIKILKGRIQSIVQEKGFEPEKAAIFLKEEYGSLGLSGLDEVIGNALKEFKSEQHRIEFLQVATIPQRRRNVWYGGPSDTGIWSGLRKYLIEVKEWDEEPTVNSIDEASSKIVSLLNNPGESSFATRSLVIGYVQSGKTANMTAVAAKAVDANYKFVIILAGMTDVLREQTQKRIETDLINQDPDRWYRWTTVDMEFSHVPDAGFPPLNPASRHLAVIKKNKWVLQRFLTMLENTPAHILRNIPFLVIDDECDQASVNASRFQDEMTAINELIRTILHRLPRAAYIGYTATPFANVLIDPAVSIEPESPDDLYPKDFIVALPKPHDYFGAESLFGRGLLDADESLPDSDGYDMIRLVKDEEIYQLRPASYRDRESFRLTVTPSLEKAIRYYLLASAARCERDQSDKHSCMLIHTTVYVGPHFDASRRVKEFLTGIIERLESQDQQLLFELEEQWNGECARVEAAQFGNDEVTFTELFEHLLTVVRSVEVVVENGISEARLDFPDDSAKRFIVIGGSVLARGLTIEGLIVSFFLRTSSQYDSLMQMGRWFGFRPGYEDLPRVWMTRDMRDGFKDLATVEAEIRNDIDVYRAQDCTPLDFAVRIRKIPGMSITARNKMLSAEYCDISFANEHVQTTRFEHSKKSWLDDNWQAGSLLVNEALNNGERQPVTVSRGRLLRDVPVGCIIRFLRNYKTHQTHKVFDEEKLIDYIESQNSRDAGSLAEWNIGIIEPVNGAPSQKEFGLLGRVRTSVRSMLWETKDGDADIKALMSKGDVLIDCPDIKAGATDTWDSLKFRRKGSIGDIPLVILYPIEALSEPMTAANMRGKTSRVALNAAGDVLGVGLLFPSAKVDTPVHYLRARLSEGDYEEYEFIEFKDGEAG